jgi:hypothetical protein
MTMRRVSPELYIGDEGRPIFNAGLFRHQAYYIPPDDVPALDRRRFWMQMTVSAMFFVALAGATEHLWSAWWAIAAFPAIFTAPAMMARWVRQRFEPVTNPSVTLDVRRTALMHSPTIGAAATAAGASALSWASIAMNHRAWIPMILVVSLFAIQVISSARQSRERREVEADYVPPSTGITR